jgi:hypothetical protein
LENLLQTQLERKLSVKFFFFNNILLKSPQKICLLSPQIFGKIFKNSFLKRKNYARRKGNPHFHACTNRPLNTSLINFLTFKIIMFYHAFKFDFYGGLFYRHWIVVIYLLLYIYRNILIQLICCSFSSMVYWYLL